MDARQVMEQYLTAHEGTYTVLSIGLNLENIMEEQSRPQMTYSTGGSLGQIACWAGP